MSTKVSTGFGWLEDDTTGNPVGVRRALDGKTFTILPTVVLTQAEYDALAVKDPNTEYNIVAA